MASTDDVVISYNGAEIASMTDSGTKTLETDGKYCEDDITVTYTKPSGGGVQTALVSETYSSYVLFYTDANMTVQSDTQIMNQYLPLGTLVFIYNNGPAPFFSTYIGLTQRAGYGSAVKGEYLVFEVTG